MLSVLRSLLRKRLTYIILFCIVLAITFIPVTVIDVDDAHELQSLIYYMKAFPGRSLPADVDPGTKLDEGVWAKAAAVSVREWRKGASQLAQKSPVVVFSKSYCPFSKRAKELLALYKLRPSPLIFEVDERDDSEAIKLLLTRITQRSTFPNVVVNGLSWGGSDEIVRLHHDDELTALLRRAGVITTRESDTSE